jgi:hypothetical protein
MTTEVSCTVDATSDVAVRLNRAIRDAQDRAGRSRSDKLSAVQGKVEELKKRGLLRRQEYAAAKTADFQKLFMSRG